MLMQITIIKFSGSHTQREQNMKVGELIGTNSLVGKRGGERE